MKQPRFFILLPFLLFSLSAFSCVHRTSTPDYEIVESYKPASCWEEVGRSARVSPDGKMAIFFYGSQWQEELIDLESGQVNKTKLLGALDQFWYTRFYHDSKLLLLGRRGDEEGWFLEGPEGFKAIVLAPIRPALLVSRWNSYCLCAEEDRDFVCRSI